MYLRKHFQLLKFRKDVPTAIIISERNSKAFQASGPAKKQCFCNTKHFKRGYLMNESKNESQSKSEKLSFGTKLSFGLSEVGLQFSWTLVSSYLTLFYTDAVGIGTAAIAAIMLGARIWDGINDPMMGVIADKTHSRWGRFRPYLLFGTPILAALNVLTFSAFNFSQTGKIIYATVTYVGLGMVYTAVCIAQGSLSNVMTADNGERMQLNTFRGIASGVSSLVLSAITMPLILYFGHGDTSKTTGYTAAAAILSLISIPCLWIAFAKCKERITVSREEQKASSFWKNFKTVFSLRDFRLEVIYEILTLTAMFGRFAVMMHYYKYVLGRTDLVAELSVVMSVCQIVSQFFIPALTKRFSKKTCLTFCNVGMGLGCLLIFGAGLGTSRLWMVFLGTGMLGFFNFLSPVLYGLTAELVDQVEINTGIRADGTGYSIFSFATKLGNAFGGSILVMILGAVGYVANQPATAAVQTNMSVVINLVPMGLYLVALIPLLMITMNNKKAKENTEILAAKRNA